MTDLEQPMDKQVLQDLYEAINLLRQAELNVILYSSLAATKCRHAAEYLRNQVDAAIDAAEVFDETADFNQPYEVF